MDPRNEPWMTAQPDPANIPEIDSGRVRNRAALIQYNKPLELYELGSIRRKGYFFVFIQRA